MPAEEHDHDYGPVVLTEEDEDGNLKETKFQACRICGAKK